ncbi:hypothetical protein R3P38DRAFT_3188960 [Favolaschia claudopus]|uniref:Uncharacterized protein n=1 Tax=Favolaschia claudopus TaxID=2862362 RepID=A0AAW0BSE3_9AGAR
MQTSANGHNRRSLRPIKYPAIPNDDEAEKRARRRAALIDRRERAAAAAAYYAANSDCLKLLVEGIEEAIPNYYGSTSGKTDTDADAGTEIREVVAEAEAEAEAKAKAEAEDEAREAELWARMCELDGMTDGELDRKMQAISDANWEARVYDPPRRTGGIPWPLPTAAPTVRFATPTRSLGKQRPLAARPTTPVKEKDEEPGPPIFDCAICKRELYPRALCGCGDAREQHLRWKAADDVAFREDRKGWMEQNAPARRLQPDLEDRWAELEKQLRDSTTAREEKEEMRRVRLEGRRAPVRHAVVEAAAIARERGYGR